jgi:hypothetical protein
MVAPILPGIAGSLRSIDVYAWEANTRSVVFAQFGGQMSTNDTGSALALRTAAMPAFTNSSDDIFGGWLLSQTDPAGEMPLPLQLGD